MKHLFPIAIAAILGAFLLASFVLGLLSNNETTNETEMVNEDTVIQCYNAEEDLYKTGFNGVCPEGSVQID